MKHFTSRPALNIFMLFALLASLLGSAVFVTPARAAGFTVTKVADTADGACNVDCSLREAITAANASGGADTITLPPGTYTLTRAGANENANATGDLDITSTITINGGSGRVIQAGTTAAAGIDRVFHVVSGTLILNNLIIRNGHARNGANGVQCGPFGPCPSTSNGQVGQDGGGILNAGTLTLNQVTISNNLAGDGGNAGNLVCTLLGPACINKAGKGGNGGGVFNTGTLTINNSTFSGNKTGKSGQAGSKACASVCTSSFSSGGQGAGLSNIGTVPMTITNSTFSGNAAIGGQCASGNPCSALGGGLHNSNASVLTITKSTFSTNSAANSGGGLLNQGTMTIKNSTFSGNSAAGNGGAIENLTGTLMIANSTFLDNTADDEGGILNWIDSTATITNSTLKNTDFYNTSSATLNLFNTILTATGAAVNCSNNFGTVNGTNNLIKAAGSTACGFTNGTNGNIVGPDPNLGALIGSPAYFLLNAGSLAINAGSDAKCAAAPVSNTSQNGVTRPQGAHCDIGAFELDNVRPTVVSSNRANPSPTAAATVDFMVIFSEPVVGVDAADFVPTASGIVSGVSIASVSGSGSIRTVRVNTGGTEGTIRLDIVNNGTIFDVLSNPLNGNFLGGQTYTVDRRAPTADFSLRINPNPSGAANVNFSILFSENVTGVDPTDFSLTTTGVSGAFIAAISGSGGSRTVTVNTGSGNGTIRLDVLDDNTIIDALANPLNGGLTGGEVYTIDKNTPTVLSSLRVNANPSAATSVDFAVTFSEDVTGVDLADFSLTTSGITGASITTISGSGGARIVTVNTGSGNGTIRLNVPATATITDMTSNLIVGLPFTSGESYTIDKTITLTLNSDGANDGFVIESSEASTIGGTLDSASTLFNVGDEAANKQIRSILHFDTSSLPDTALITSVTLKIKQQSVVGTNPFTTHGGLRVDISNPFFGTATALQAADFQATATSLNAATFNATPVNGIYNAILNGAGKANINFTGPTQFRLRFAIDDNNDLGADFIKFFSGNAAVINRPQLVITYTVP